MSARKKVPLSDRQKQVREALQLTWLLKGRLKSFQMYFLRIGEMLALARDQKMYETLGHPDLENYAEKRLNLARSTLYRYLNVYEWVRASHPEWLVKHPKGVIPDLSDVADLMWIEQKLADKALDPVTRKTLAGLQAKALAGKLAQRDLRQFRKRAKPQSDALKGYLSTLFTLKRRGARLQDMPPEVIAKLEDVIEVLQHVLDMRKAGGTLAKAS